MAEALGVAVNVIAVIQLAQEVVKATAKYAKAYKSATADVKALRIELTSLIVVLDVLKDDFEEEPPEEGKSTALSVVGGPLWLCNYELQAITAKLGTKDQKMTGLKRLLWPFKDDEIKEHLARIERAKSVLDLSLDADQNVVIKEIQKLVSETQKTANDTLSAVEDVRKDQIRLTETLETRKITEEQQEALKWLYNGVDYESNHREARKLHEPGTGEWFIGEEDGAFEQWLAGDKKCIWLHGIPGAGKTVLMSTIIATSITRIDRTVGNVACGYFYFSFSDSSKQTTSNMLSSILAQICSQIPFPEEIVNFYTNWKSKPGRPGEDEMMENIESVCGSLDRVLIFLDALDECDTNNQTTGGDLLSYVERLSSLQKTQTIVTSRKETEIERAMLDLGFSCIPIRTDVVDDDIALFVWSILDREDTLKRHNKRSGGRILTALVSQAQGMFRWVECQLDILRKCKSVAQVNAALNSLPKTLYSTYDRILENIPEENREFLRRALAWIIYAEEPLHSVQIAEAMIVEPGSSTLDQDTRFGDILDHEELEFITSSVEEICGSLIRRGREKVFRKRKIENDSYFPEYEDVCAPEIVLAHASVQEYLLSDRLADGSLSWWSLKHPTGSALVLEAIITYLEWEDFDHERTSLDSSWYMLMESEKCYPLINYCINKWHMHVQDRMQDARDLLTRAAVFLQPKPVSNNFLFWQYAHDEWNFLENQYSSRSRRSLFSNPDSDQYQSLLSKEKWIAGPLYHAARFGLVNLCKALIERGDPIDDDEGREGSPFLIATLKKNVDVMEVLREAGVNIFKETRGIYPIWEAIEHEEPETLRFFIRHSTNRQVDLELRDEKGLTLLQRTAYNYKGYTSNNSLRALIEDAGLNPNDALHPALEGPHYAASDNLPMIVQLGADINYTDPAFDLLVNIPPDRAGRTIMYKIFKTRMSRANNRHYQRTLLRLLRDHGAHDEAVTPLEMASLFLHRSSGDEEREKHELELISIMESGLPSDVVKEFVSGSNALERVIEDGTRAGLVNRMIIFSGIDVNNYTVLDPRRSDYAHSLLGYVAVEGDDETVDYLLQLGAKGIKIQEYEYISESFARSFIDLERKKKLLAMGLDELVAEREDCEKLMYSFVDEYLSKFKEYKEEKNRIQTLKALAEIGGLSRNSRLELLRKCLFKSWKSYTLISIRSVQSHRHLSLYVGLKPKRVA